MCGIVGLFAKSPGGRGAARRAPRRDARPDGRPRARQRRARGLPRAGAGRLDKMSLLLRGPGRRLGGVRDELARASAASRAGAGHARRAVVEADAADGAGAGCASGTRAARDERRRADRDLQGGRASRARSSSASRSRDCRARTALGHTRMATESRVTTEGSHPFSTGLDLCLVHNGSLSNHNRLRARAAARGHRVPDRQRHRGRGRLPDVAAARGRDRSRRRSRAASTTSTASTRSSSAPRTASRCCATRSPASRPCWRRPTTGSRWRPSTARSRCCPARRTREVWEPEPARVYAWERERGLMAVEPGAASRSSTSRATPLRELNARLHDVAGDGPRPRAGACVNPNGAHAVACRPRRRDRGRGRRPRRLLLRRHEQARDGARARQRGRRASPRTSCPARSCVDGNASQSAGATGRGGLVVVQGDASARCGISMKGVDIVVRGSVGHMSAFMAQTGCLVVCGDAGEALGDSIYEARLYVRGAVAALGADCVEKELRDEHRRRAARAARRAPGSSTPTRPTSAATARRGGSTTSTSTTRGRTDDATRPAGCRLRESATFDRNAIAEIQRAAREGIYDIRGLGAKRRVPHFDDLLFLGASVSRYPLEGYRERCDTDVVLGDAHASQAARAEDPDHDRGHELRRAVGAGEGGARPRRDRDGHLDDDRRRRHDARRSAGTRRRSSTSCCRRATA